MATCYEADSYSAHLERAEEMGLRVAVYLSRRVMLDIDTPEDIKELLRVGGNTAAFSFLREKTAGKFLKKRLKQLSG
jgi:2-phospho-L-lactate guanylyltransferase (CobY/MobA/RfbA family)